MFSISYNVRFFPCYSSECYAAALVDLQDDFSVQIFDIMFNILYEASHDSYPNFAFAHVNITPLR